MALIFGVPVFRRYDRLKLLIETVERGTLRPGTYMIVDSGRKISEALQAGVFVRPETHTHIYHAPEQLNLAECWNTVIRHYPHDLLVLCRDENVHVERDTVEKLVKVAEGSSDFMIRATSDVHLQKPGLVEKIGYYHEGRRRLIVPEKLAIPDIDVSIAHPGELVPPALAEAIFSRTITVK